MNYQEIAQEIVTNLGNPNVPLEDTLRKTVILSKLSGSTELGKWAKCELNGYFNEARTPEYRKIPIVLKANLASHMGQVTNAPVLFEFPEEFPEGIRNHHNLNCGIAEIQGLINSGKPVVNFFLPPELFSILNKLAQDQLQTATAVYQQASTQSLGQVLSSVKNSLLDLLLENFSMDDLTAEVNVEELDKAICIIFAGGEDELA